LQQGVSPLNILDQVRDNIGSDFNRIHLLERKDISNISKAYGIKVLKFQ